MSAEPPASFCIVLTTYAKDEVGSKIADALLSARLAACVQVLPIKSLYKWKRETVRESENLMLIKAKTADFEEIKETILRHHDYEIPEVISVGIDQGFAGYFKWMTEVTR